jgi:hypothetical protein
MKDHESRISLLEAEVQRLRDCEDIRQILARYGPLADSADTAERRLTAGKLFADSGVYDLGKDWKAVGPADVGELLNNPEHLDLVANGSAHVMGLPYITLDGDHASALSYSQVYRYRDGAFSVWRVSINYWECARIRGIWKVVHRTNRLLDGSNAARDLLMKADNRE